MNLLEVNEICKEKLGVLHYLQSQKINHADVQCIACQHACSLVKAAGKLAGYMWRCPRCKHKTSVLKDSFLERSKITPTTFLYLVYFWSTKTSLMATVHPLGLSSKTVVDYYNYFREICSWKLLNNQIQLGGPGLEVQIDESVFVKAKQNRGRNVRRRNTWVFGAYDVARKEGYMRFVRKRDAATLLPIIENVVAPGSVIVSDEW